MYRQQKFCVEFSFKEVYILHLRVEYRVGPDLKFLANLDMMHVIERALRRAEIPYALTEGFNPHIKIAMGTVLPVGLWGEKEYFDLELQEDIDCEEFLLRMNKTLPAGMDFNKCMQIDAGTPALMKEIAAADYCYVIRGNNLPLGNVKDLLFEKHLMVKSRGKKKDVEKDLRPGLYKIETMQQKDAGIIKVRVAVGEPLNVRYDEVIQLFETCNISAQTIIDIYRCANYILSGNNFLPPV